jgi:iron(II)-dependent oxidoreductase
MIAAVSEAASLTQMLLAARSRTLGLVADLSGAQLLGPRLTIVNPPLWEIGHLGWFQERWCLRRRAPDAFAPSMLEGADALYDSSAVPHAVRWDLPLPALDVTLDYLSAVLERVGERLAKPDAELAYFAELCALHEEMHAEAFTYTRQTLGYRPPPQTGAAVEASPGACAGDAEIGGGEFLLGADRGDGFVFDNEKWAHPVHVAPFRIARAAVTNGEFAQFVEDAGYARRELWSAEGWAWREAAAAEHPVYWLESAASGQERRYDALCARVPEEPVMHVNWHEAQAYCRWAGRRLPTEAEWEFAAAATPETVTAKSRYPWGDQFPDAARANLFGAAAGPIAVGALPAGDSAWGCRQMIGNVWEWTADAFVPYPGFVADPYADYSQPWFGDHQVLRGGSHATRACLIRNTWRNFHTPDRRDVFAGFRTCAA